MRLNWTLIVWTGLLAFCIAVHYGLWHLAKFIWRCL